MKEEQVQKLWALANAVMTFSAGMREENGGGIPDGECPHSDALDFMASELRTLAEEVRQEFYSKPSEAA